MIRGLSGLLLRLRYKIPRPHRYKIPRFPIPLSWLDLWRSRRALRYKRTSTPTSIVWHRAAWPSSGMVPGAGPSPMIDHHKVLLRPERLRQVPSRFSWCDQRLFRSDLCSGCGSDALALYLFLLTVADSRGLSFYSDPSIQRVLRLDPLRLTTAREQLLAADLVAYTKPHYQLLSLPEPSKPKPSSARLGEAASIGDILRRAMGQGGVL
jgi:hypothetical protein